MRYDVRMMRPLIPLALALGCCAAPPPEVQQAGPDPELAGRVAGAPQRCVPISSQQALRVSEGDHHTLIYGSGRTLWVNPLGPHCSFRYDDVLVTEPFGSSYCRGDLVRSFDRNSHIPGPACILGNFIPYTRR
jgi:hypothetical protein